MINNKHEEGRQQWWLFLSSKNHLNDILVHSRKKIWQIIFPATTLRQFFVIHLSRKAEGNGPMTPWQPKMVSKTLKGANSILIQVGIDKTDSSF